jgi:hypothetical protein
MTESYPTDLILNALSGLDDAEQGVLFPDKNEEPCYTSLYKMIYRMLDVARRAGDLRVFKDSAGALKFGVRPGRWMNGDSAVTYAGAANQTLADNATNYIYLTAAGTLTVNQSGFPVPSVTPHLPLGTIATGTASAGGVSGSYSHVDITDYRGRAFLSVPGSSGSGGEEFTVEADTHGVGSPNIITADETGKFFTNEGCGAKNYHSLPAPAAGLRFFGDVQNAYGMRFTATAGGTIRLGESVTAANGHIESTTVGSRLDLVCINGTEWMAGVPAGTWTLT